MYRCTDWWCVRARLACLGKSLVLPILRVDLNFDTPEMPRFLLGIPTNEMNDDTSQDWQWGYIIVISLEPGAWSLDSGVSGQQSGCW